MPSAAADLAAFLRATGAVTVLTGAGVSTASGIPDYRDRDGNWKHAQPVQFADFVGHAATRTRYWARSFAGWQRFKQAEPNAAHCALAALEQYGLLDTLVTQNVDGLHQRAGSRKVIDLHGRLDSVTCLDCGHSLSRDDWQRLLLHYNPDFRAHITRLNPDGDAELHDDDYVGFAVPDCSACGGTMKPDVVFFGEAVPRERVADATSAVACASALLVIGSSLMVYSGLRFVRQAAELGKPVVVVNRGRTRGDDLATLKLDADCGECLAAAAAEFPERGTGT